MNRIEFGKKLTRERLKLELKPNELAKRCKVTTASQYLYERGERLPGSAYLELAFAQGINPSNLFSTIKPLPANEITIESLINIFSETDKESRNKLGRLLEFEFRLKMFVELIRALPANKINALKKK